MARRFDTTRAAQILVFLLLLTTVVLVAWWLMDQAAFVAAVDQRVHTLYDRDVTAAGEALAKGWSRERLEELYPHLVIGEEGGARVREEALEELADDRRRHLKQYFWEGSFFLVVLVVAMAVLWRALSQEALLRRRQQNFLAAVSHELKTPLASLQLATETMAMRDPPKEKRQELLGRNLEDLKRLEVMVSNLLQTSRLDSGRIGLVREPVPLGAATARALQELGGLVDGTRVEVEIPAQLTVQADPDALAAVLRNLISNAVKATAGCEDKWVRIEAEDGGDYVRLRISDNGFGFPPQEAERLFEKFYRPGNELRRHSPGTGLGLYIVRRFIELDGGSVEARSEGPGKGAVFTVDWPTAG